MPTEQSPPFKLVAGHVALDFVNTLDNRYQPERVIDLIPAYPDLVRFCLEAGLVTPAQADSLRHARQGTETALRDASELRETLDHIFTGIVSGSAIAAEDLAVLNGLLQTAMRHRVLASGNGGVAWQWTALEDDAWSPLWLIVEAAAKLLVSEDLKRVRECGNETCRWLFLDTSKNGSRRWCDMKLCGNRVKARNYYRRARKEHLD